MGISIGRSPSSTEDYIVIGPTVVVDGTSGNAQGSTFPAAVTNTTRVRLSAITACYYKIGLTADTVTAVTQQDAYLSAGAGEIVVIPALYKIAVVTGKMLVTRVIKDIADISMTS